MKNRNKELKYINWAILVCVGAVAVSLLVAPKKAEARDCKALTYENTRTERQALHHKGDKQKAEQITRDIEKCEVQLAGGFIYDQTQALHDANDAEFRYNRNMHTASRY